jgi:AcrR family transcriptional regulator
MAATKASRQQSAGRGPAGGVRRSSDRARGVLAADGTTRARIERAALELFAARGIDAATTRAIAEAADLSEGALYRHFRSKEAIAESLFAAIHNRLARLVRDTAARAGGIEAQAGAVVDAYCQVADDDWMLFSYHLLTTAHFLPTPPGDDNPVAAAEEIVEAAMARGEIPKGDVVLVTAMALGVVLQPALHKVYCRLSGPLAPHRARLKSALMAVLNCKGV